MSEARNSCPIDHHSAEYAANAVEIHARLREECPVGWSDAYQGFWVMSSYADVRNALKSPQVFSSARVEREDGLWIGGAAIPGHDGPSMYPLEIDPPEGLIYRGVISKWMSRTAIEPLRERVVAYADEMLDRAEKDGELDVVTNVGMLPAFVTALILGLDPDLADEIAWPFHALDVVERDSPEFAKVGAARKWLVELVADACQSRRENPLDDGISQLVQTRTPDGELLPLGNCIWTVMTVIGGGVATTTAALEHCLMAIDKDPEIRARLIADPTLVPKLIEEALRVNPPVRQLARLATEDVEVGGQKISAGEQILASVLSANHDTAVFEHPEVIDIDRPTPSHMTFGYGVHRCVGNEVARLQLSVIIERLLARFPNFKVRREECRRFVEAAHNDGYITFPIDLGVE